MSYFSCFFYGVNETLTYFLFQMNFVCQPSREIFHGRADIQNSFEIINEKISGGMFDTIRHPFFLYYICKINGGIQILIVIL